MQDDARREELLGAALEKLESSEGCLSQTKILEGGLETNIFLDILIHIKVSLLTQ